MDANLRERQITRTSLIGIAVNVLLAAFKAFAGLLAGSIAIVLDAANNLTDAISSIITIVGIQLARRKPDRTHPHGHGRIEYFSAILVSGIVLLAGVTSLVESGKKIIHPEMPNYSALTLGIVMVAIVVKLLLGRFVKRQGEQYHSTALVASGSDAAFDAVISAATLIGAVITLAFRVSVDGIIGVVIAGFILKAGMEMLLESLNSVVGSRPDSETTRAIKRTVAQMPGVLGAFDLVLHDYGPDSAIGSIHVEVPAEMTAREFHQLTANIQSEIYRKYRVFLTVGLYAVDGARVEERKIIRDIALSHQGILGVHGIFFDEVRKRITFDAVVDFTVDCKAFVQEVNRQVYERFPDYAVDAKVDTDYSD